MRKEKKKVENLRPPGQPGIKLLLGMTREKGDQGHLARPVQFQEKPKKGEGGGGNSGTIMGREKAGGASPSRKIRVLNFRDVEQGGKRRRPTEKGERGGQSRQELFELTNRRGETAKEERRICEVSRSVIESKKQREFQTYLATKKG